MPTLSDVTCVILDSEVSIRTGPFLVKEGKGLVTIADRLELVSDKEIVDPIISKEVADVTFKNGDHVEGCTILSRNDKSVTIRTGDIIREGRYTDIRREVGKRFSFIPTNGDHLINLHYGWENGMTVTTVSRLHFDISDDWDLPEDLPRGAKYALVHQTLSVTNSTHFDLKNIEKIHFSFQKRSSYQNEAMSYHPGRAMLSAARVTSESSDVSDISMPISIGPIASLPASSTSQLPIIDTVLLQVVERYLDFRIDDRTLSFRTLFEMRVVDLVGIPYLLPSFCRIQNEDGVEQAKATLPLKRKGETFELFLGMNRTVTITDIKRTDDHFEAKFTSVSLDRYKIRFSGWDVPDGTTLDLPAGRAVVHKFRLKERVLS